MNATINTFPAFHSMTSPRAWILAVIVLLHLGFAWLLSSGMGQELVKAFRPPTTYVDIPTVKPVDPPPQPDPHPINIDGTIIDKPLPPTPVPFDDEPPVRPDSVTETGSGPVAQRRETGTSQPVMAQPEVDPRTGLSEPLYPASEIRAEHTGTVLLSVFVLENGRVGEVRLDQSSGWPKLDESALKEARRWKFKPGTRDGVAVAMWKQVPITFQLQGEHSRRF